MFVRSLGALVTVLAFVLAAPVVNVKRAGLPTPVSAATARTYLAALTVAAESNSPAYDRDLFNHWITVGGCTTRQTVLIRDATSYTAGSGCAVTTGKWTSAYDGVAATLASDLDIDHVVPLKEAWVSGARNWNAQEREDFANDLTRPQLIAVTDNLNQAKGDQDPAEWMVPLSSYKCTYVRAWVTVKHYYDLTVDSAEKSALTSYLASC